MIDHLGGYRKKVVKLNSKKKRTSSSTRWLQRQVNDPYVTKAKIDGYRSRAAYKLIEINEKFKILQKNMVIIDLGAAPGGWSQVASLIAQDSKVIAIDILDIEPLAGVQIIKKDFCDVDTPSIINQIITGCIDNKNSYIDLVMSDMASNSTGHRATDHIKIIALCEIALEFAVQNLKPGGAFITKVFAGGMEHNLLKKVKENFNTVKHFKPKSSRADSKEFYLVAMNRKTK